MNKFKKVNLWLFVILSFAVSFYAQDKKNLGKVEDFKLNSKLMSREMPYRVIFPLNYQPEKDKKLYPVVYLLHGLTGHFNNWTDKTKLVEYAGSYGVIIIMPEGNDGWYSDSISVANDKYESYIIKELIPEVDKKFSTIPNRQGRVIAGLSMGGYGSLKFGLKYPESFVLVGSFSGALMAASWSDKLLGNGWKVLTDSIMGVYGAEGSQTRKDNDIYQMAQNMTPEKTKSLPFMYIDCGTEDGLIVSNRDFSKILLEKKIPHEFRQLPGKHDWKYWDSQVVEFLQLTTKFIK